MQSKKNIHYRHSAIPGLNACLLYHDAIRICGRAIAHAGGHQLWESHSPRELPRFLIQSIEIVRVSNAGINGGE